MRTFRDYLIMFSLPLTFLGAALLAALDYVLALFPPGENLALAGASFGVVRNDAGSAICSALQNDMRHESRTSRIGAPRHT